jgi:hypothetical protein
LLLSTMPFQFISLIYANVCFSEYS